MQKIRNIAIIAHVDHGKTTIVDKMLLAGNLFRENQNAGELILDNNDLERERGITILSKNVSINYKGYKINIIDTPGHADFGGEVERVLNMADGCLLLVDAFEGPMPQTRFVLQKAIQIGLKPVVVVNKVDKPNCRPEEVQEMVFDLMFSLDATEEQLNFPTLFGSAKNGWMNTSPDKPTDNILPLLDAIIEYIPEPEVIEGDTQMLITSLDFSSYVGRIAIGRVHRGTIREGQEIALCKRDGSVVRQRVKELHTFEGMGRKRVESVSSGDICALVGIDGFEIGDTVADVIRLPWTLAVRQGERKQEPADMLADAHIRQLLDAMGCADIQLDRNPRDLSGGQAARVSLARTILTKPRVLLADEVDAGLDEENADKVADLLKRAAEQGAGVVRIRHRAPDGRASRIMVLSDGELNEQQAPAPASTAAAAEGEGRRA